MNSVLPHEKLLIALCRLDFSDDYIASLRDTISSVSSWKTFTWLANEHGISALVYNNLRKLELLGLVPEQYRDILHNSLLVSLTRNTYLLDKLTEAAKILKAKGITVELLKGMALELSLYGNSGLRQMNDVDILIDRDRCVKAWKILKKEGYSSVALKSPLYKLIPLYEGKHLPELHRDDLSLEIHHNLFPGNLELTRRMISESSSLVIGHQEMQMPPPSLHFLYLVRHLQYHEQQGDSQLRLYTDLFLLVERYREDILSSDLIELSRLAGEVEYLAGRLLILSSFWGVDMPGFIEVLINSVDKSAIIEDFERFLSKPKGHQPITKAETFTTDLGKVPGLHRKIIHIAGELFPSPTFMKYRYKTHNRLVALLYYPVRWFRITYLLLSKI